MKIKGVVKENIYLTEERILAECQFNNNQINQSSFGDKIYNYKEFLEELCNRCYIKPNEFAEVLIDGLIVENSYINFDDNYNIIIGKFTLNKADVYKMFGDRLKFAWYNK